MAVTTPKASAGPYIADGKVTQFAFEFPVVDGTHVAVYVDGNRAENGFSVSGENSGGEVQFNTPPVAGSRIVILRDVPFTQEIDLQNNTAFLPEVLEAAFDKLTMMCQELAESDARSVKWLPAMEQEKIPEQLLTDAVNSAVDVKTLYPELRLLGDDLKRQLADTSAEIEETEQRVTGRVNDLIEQLTNVGVMPEDTTIRFESISAGNDGDAVEAAITQNKAKIAAIPKNLGGHTLTVVLNNQEIAEFDAQTDLAGRYDFDGFCNGVIQIGVSNTRGKISSNDRIRSLSFRSCHASIRFVNIDFTAAATDRIARVSPGAVLLVNCSGGAVFQGCSFFGKFRNSVDLSIDPYDPYGYAIAAVDTPVYVPTIVKSSDTIDAEPMDTWGESITEDQYVSAAYGSTELNDVTHLWNEESTRPGYINGVLYYPKPEPEILLRRWNTNNQ